MGMMTSPVPTPQVSFGQITGDPNSNAALNTKVNSIASLAGSLVESKYTRCLVFGDVQQQSNAVKDYSQNICDLQYLGGATGFITDAELYNTEAGWLATGQGTNKALMIHKNFLEGWNVANGQSMLVQMRFKIPTTLSASDMPLFGNGYPGVFGVYCRVKAAGNIQVGVNAGAAYGSGVTYVETSTITADTEHTLTVLINGIDKTYSAWHNNKQTATGQLQNINITGTGDTGANHFGVGCLMGTSYSPGNAQPLRTRAFRMVTTPAGVMFKDPAMLAYRFHRDYSVLINDVDMVGATA